MFKGLNEIKITTNMTISDVSSLSHIQVIHLYHLPLLTSIKGLGLGRQTCLHIECCPLITDFNLLGQGQRDVTAGIMQLLIKDCRGLTSLDGLGCIKRVEIVCCPNLRDLSDLSEKNEVVVFRHLNYFKFDMTANRHSIDSLKPLLVHGHKVSLVQTYNSPIGHYDIFNLFKNLHSLDLSYSRVAINAWPLKAIYSLSLRAVGTIEGWTALGQHPQQHLLDISQNPCISGDLSYLGKGSIRRLNLSSCLNVTDISGLGNIEELDLSYCSNITDFTCLGDGLKQRKLTLNGTCIREFTVKLLKVQSLSCMNCAVLNDISALDKANHVGIIARLKELDLSGCLKILAIPGYLGSIYDLNLSRCFISDFGALGKGNHKLNLSHTTIADVANLMSVYDLNLTQCHFLRDVAALKAIPILKISGRQLDRFSLDYATHGRHPTTGHHSSLW
jgi:hypothetical protein